MLNKKTYILFLSIFINYFNFTLYLLMVPVVAGYFFGGKTMAGNILWGYIVLALGHLGRPLGGLVLGLYGDFVDRKRAYLISVLMMCFSTICIPLIPSYAKIGALSFIALTICKFLQTSCIGAEFIGTILIGQQINTFSKRGLVGSIVSSSAASGRVIALLLTHVALIFKDVYVWKTIFLLGGIFNLVIALVAYKNISLPTPTQKKDLTELTTSKNYHIESFILIAAISAVMGGFSAFFLYFIKTYLFMYVKLPENISSLIPIVGASFYIVFVIYFGRLTTKIHAYDFLSLALKVAVCAIIPIFYCFMSGNIIAAFLAEVTGMMLFGAIMAGSTAVITLYFNEKIKFSGTAFSYNLGNYLTFGFFPSIFMYLLEKTSIKIIPALMLMATLLLCIFALKRFKSVTYALIEQRV